MINTLKCTFFTRVSMVLCCNVIQCDVDARPILFFDLQMVELMKYSFWIILFIFLFTVRSFWVQFWLKALYAIVRYRDWLWGQKGFETLLLPNHADRTSVSVSLLFVGVRESSLGSVFSNIVNRLFSLSVYVVCCMPVWTCHLCWQTRRKPQSIKRHPAHILYRGL